RSLAGPGRPAGSRASWRGRCGARAVRSWRCRARRGRSRNSSGGGTQECNEMVTAVGWGPPSVVAGPRHRDPHGEGGPDALPRGDGDVAAVGAHVAAGDREPQAGAGDRGLAHVLGAVEVLEHALELLRA